MPWLSNKFNLSKEDKLWIAFINGCTQNIVTTYYIFRKYPSLKKLNLEEMDSWWNENHVNFKVGSGWDTDRKYFKIGKTGLINCINSYKSNVYKFGSQEEFFDNLMNSEDKYLNFRNTWNTVRNNFLSLGNFSKFSIFSFSPL